MASTSQCALCVLVLGITAATCNARCSFFEIECDNGRCTRGSRCNGIIDCSDNSDEYHCGRLSCRWDVCDDGQCCFGCRECDGSRDCLDGSDEELCVCDSDEYECDNGECHSDPFNDVECDGFDDCNDGSDEHGCLDTRMVVGVSFGAFCLCFFCLCCICISGYLYAVHRSNGQRRTYHYGYRQRRDVTFQPPSSRVATAHSQQPHPTAPSNTILMTPATELEPTVPAVDPEAISGAQFDPASSALHWEEPPPYPGPPQEMYTPTALRKPDDPPPYPVSSPPPSYGSHLQ